MMCVCAGGESENRRQRSGTCRIIIIISWKEPLNGSSLVWNTSHSTNSFTWVCMRRKTEREIESVRPNKLTGGWNKRAADSMGHHWTDLECNSRRGSGKEHWQLQRWWCFEINHEKEQLKNRKKHAIAFEQEECDERESKIYGFHGKYFSISKKKKKLVVKLCIKCRIYVQKLLSQTTNEKPAFDPECIAHDKQTNWMTERTPKRQ